MFGTESQEEELLFNIIFYCCVDMLMISTIEFSKLLYIKSNDCGQVRIGKGGGGGEFPRLPRKILSYCQACLNP